jgi:hypothetical protein
MEGSCEYIEQAVADSRWEVVLHISGWAGGLQPHSKTSELLRNVHCSLEPGRILRQNDRSTEKWKKIAIGKKKA